MTTPSASDYDVLTFDCYGTLIDWAAGIVGYITPLLEAHDAHVTDAFILEFFAEAEPVAEEAGGSYAEVLKEVLRRLGARLAFTPTEEDLEGFAQSVKTWPPFDDTVSALRRLGERFDLVVVSNVDNDLFAGTADQLGVSFAHVVTAQDVGAYKPNRAMFDAALKVIGDKRHLHVAQSLYHDIAPASELGWSTVWIQRSSSAARDHDAAATWAYPSLGDFADAILQS